jgi:hypothetical protein
MNGGLTLWSFSPLSEPSFRGRAGGADLPGSASLGGIGRRLPGGYSPSRSVSTTLLELLRILASHRRRRRGGRR